jgi:hypothetical protein
MLPRCVVNGIIVPSRIGIEDSKWENNISCDVLADSNDGTKKPATKRSGSKKGKHSQQVDGVPIFSLGKEGTANRTRARGVPKG